MDQKKLLKILVVVLFLVAFAAFCFNLSIPKGMDVGQVPTNTNTDTQTPEEEDDSEEGVAFAGNTFRIATYNGVAVSGDYLVSFGDASLAGKLCNNITGSYTLQSDMNTVTANLAATKMFCTDRALMSMEQDFLNMFSGTGSSITRTSGGVVLRHMQSGTTFILSIVR